MVGDRVLLAPGINRDIRFGLPGDETVFAVATHAQVMLKFNDASQTVPIEQGEQSIPYGDLRQRDVEVERALAGDGQHDEGTPRGML